MRMLIQSWPRLLLSPTQRKVWVSKAIGLQNTFLRSRYRLERHQGGSTGEDRRATSETLKHSQTACRLLYILRHRLPVTISATVHMAEMTRPLPRLHPCASVQPSLRLPSHLRHLYLMPPTVSPAAQAAPTKSLQDHPRIRKTAYSDTGVTPIRTCYGSRALYKDALFPLLLVARITRLDMSELCTRTILCLLHPRRESGRLIAIWSQAELMFIH